MKSAHSPLHIEKPMQDGRFRKRTVIKSNSSPSAVICKIFVPGAKEGNNSFVVQTTIPDTVLDAVTSGFSCFSSYSKNIDTAILCF